VVELFALRFEAHFAGDDAVEQDAEEGAGFGVEFVAAHVAADFGAQMRFAAFHFGERSLKVAIEHGAQI
jgi:hypothetical protein